MYYTDKPNVFSQQKLEIPYNILSVPKRIIYTLYKVYTPIFIQSNCQINFKSIKIPYNILFILKTSILTLFKVNIEIFVWYNCRKKRIIQTNYPFFGWIQYILSATRTFKPSIIISFCWKLAKTFKRFQKVLSQVDFPSIKHSILRLPRRLS